jgi:hypothetical protein
MSTEKHLKACLAEYLRLSQYPIDRYRWMNILYISKIPGDTHISSYRYDIM